MRRALIRKRTAVTKSTSFTELVGNYAKAEQSRGARLRNAALREILSTEKTYHESLRKLNDICASLRS
jgi:hypothetical protein